MSKMHPNPGHVSGEIVSPDPEAEIRTRPPRITEPEAWIDGQAWDLPRDQDTHERVRGMVGGRYEVVGDVGAGGLSKIYRVRHTHIGKEFALKILHESVASDLTIQQRFIREARVLSRMEHPSIVRITDFGIDERHGAYIVMEMLRGGTLLDELRSHGRLPLHRAAYIALQLADALCYVHALGVVHCDVKSENVLLCPVGHHRRRRQVKLIDFGISRERSFEQRVRRGELGGTPTYMAPEHIRGHAPHPSMDIYSLGVLFYELITGHLPFTGDLLEVLRAQLRDPPQPPSVYLEEPLPPTMEKLVLKALAKDASDRFASMTQFLYELRTVSEMLELPLSRGASVQVMEAPTEASDDAMTCANTVYPMFRIDRFTEVSQANPAFVEFLESTPEAVAGLPLEETRLMEHFPEVVKALVSHVQLHPSAPFQRLLLFEPGQGRTIPLLLTVAPERQSQTGDEQAYTGMIVPLLADLV